MCTGIETGFSFKEVISQKPEEPNQTSSRKVTSFFVCKCESNNPIPKTQRKQPDNEKGKKHVGGFCKKT